MDNSQDQIFFKFEPSSQELHVRYLQYNTIQYNTIQYNTIQYSTWKSISRLKYDNILLCIVKRKRVILRRSQRIFPNTFVPMSYGNILTSNRKLARSTIIYSKDCSRILVIQCELSVTKQYWYERTKIINYEIKDMVQMVQMLTIIHTNTIKI